MSDNLKISLSEYLLEAADNAIVGWGRKHRHEVKIIGIDARHRQYKVIVDDVSPARYFSLDLKENH